MALAVGWQPLEECLHRYAHWDQNERFCLGSFPRHGARGACNEAVVTGLEATPALRRRAETRCRRHTASFLLVGFLAC